MVIDMGYWSKVFKRLIILIISLIAIYLAFKLSLFYMPFLIAFVISLIIEPAIRFVARKTKLTRKVSAIIVLVVTFGILLGLIGWGITTLISEASNLLQSGNMYFEKAYAQIQNFITNFNFDKIKIPENVMNIVSKSAGDFLGTLSETLKNVLTNLVNGITMIPTIAIYVAITFIAIYFITTDKIYILDQLEHHIPTLWMKKLTVHLKGIISTLGSYLKAEIILIVISFVISLIGMYIFYFMGLNVKYPLIAALAIGFVDALPILGSGTVMIPWAIISGIDGDIKLGIYILVLWLIMSIVRQFIEPRIVSNQIGVHPIFTLIAMYTGFKFIGVIGMLVGPIILIILQNIYGNLIDKGIMKSIFDRR